MVLLKASQNIFGAEGYQQIDHYLLINHAIPDKLGRRSGEVKNFVSKDNTRGLKMYIVTFRAKDASELLKK